MRGSYTQQRMMRLTRRAFMGRMGAAAAAFGVWGSFLDTAAWSQARRPRYVILVDWDGFDPAYLGRVATPTLDALADSGSRSILDGSFPTLSNPSRATMSTGAWPERHGNVAFIWDPATNTVVGQNRSLAAETIAQALAAEGRTLASVQWYMVQDHGASFGDPSHLYVQPGGDAARRTDVAIDILNRRPVDSGGQMVTVPEIPDFLAVYMDGLDTLGHAEGAESANLAPLLAEQDHQLGRLVQATKDVGIYSQTAFIVTGDHGMTTWTQGIGNKVYDAVSGEGFQPQFVTSSAAPDTEVVMVVGGVLNLHLRGAAVDGKARIKAAIEGIPEVLQVLDNTNLTAMHASDRHGDLVAEPERPYGFSTTAPAGDGVAGLHGTTREIRVPLFLAGEGIGSSPPQSPRLVDIAPTISALLGVRAPAHTQGRVLSESLAAPDVPGPPEPSGAAVASSAAVAPVAGSSPVAPGAAGGGTGARLRLGTVLYTAHDRRARRLRVYVHAAGTRSHRVLVTLRRAGRPAVMGRSAHFSIDRRRLIAVRLGAQLRPGSYVLAAAGRDVNGRIVRASRLFRVS
jgi:arylsulfatase A-like enzyme